MRACSAAGLLMICMQVPSWDGQATLSRLTESMQGAADCRQGISSGSLTRTLSARKWSLTEARSSLPTERCAQGMEPREAVDLLESFVLSGATWLLLGSASRTQQAPSKGSSRQSRLYLSLQEAPFNLKDPLMAFSRSRNSSEPLLNTHTISPTIRVEPDVFTSQKAGGMGIQALVTRQGARLYRTWSVYNHRTWSVYHHAV